MNKKIINFRKNWKSKVLSFKKTPIPKSDIDKSPIEKYENVKKRFKHLSKILFELYKIYHTDKDLYTNEFIKLVGLYIIKEWPHKDFLFYSEESSKDNYTKEHWTPISFFRDLFVEKNITKKDFYDSLLYFYRVVMISKKQNKSLDNHHFKATRPFNAYDVCNILIHDKTLWDNIYGDMDKSINKILMNDKS